MRPFREFGYIAGQNFAYLKANELDNLITLCRPCHQLVENAGRFQGALSGLGHVLRHVALLFLMCDLKDIGILMDFGVVKLDAETQLTKTGALLGTPAYMSPEQCKDASRVDYRSDIYSLGIMLFEMLANRLPVSVFYGL